MSYINDALKRAQRERDKRYASYGSILQGSTDRRVSRKWSFPIIAGAMILLLAIVALVLSEQDFTPAVPPKPLVEQAPANVAEKPSVMPQTALKTGEARVPLSAASVDVQFDPEKEYGRALEKQKGRRFSEAEALYKRILGRDARHVKSLNNLGVIYLSQGRTTLAAQMFRKALAIKKDYVDPYYNLACLYTQKRDLSEGLRYLREAETYDKKVKEWAREDSDLRPLRELHEYRDFLNEP